MSSYLLDAYLVIALVILLWKIKVVKPANAINEDFLSINNCNAMRGFFALTPLIVHIANTMSYSKVMNWWTLYGASVVCGFFVFAGYGLMKQYIARDNYKKGFLVKRIPRIIIPYIAVTILFWVGDFWFFGFLYPISGVINAILCGEPIVAFSWFIIHLILFYIWFFILMNICGKHYNLMIVGAIFYYAVTSFIFYKQGFGAHWYETSIGLAIGMALAIYEKSLISLLKKRYWLVFSMLLVITVIVYKFGIPVIYDLFPNDFLIKNTVDFTMICLCIILWMAKFEIGNPVNRFLGSISLEIYLLHGFVILMFKNGRYSMTNNFLFAILVPVITIIMAYIMKKCMDLILGLIYKKKK